MFTSRHALAFTALLVAAVQASAYVSEHDSRKALAVNPILAVDSAPESEPDDEEPGIRSGFRQGVTLVGLPFIAITAIAGMWLLFTRTRVGTKNDGPDHTAGAK